MTSEELKALTLEGFERMFNQGDLDFVDKASRPARSTTRSRTAPTSARTSRT